jgi:phosphatidylinositol glycan class V
MAHPGVKGLSRVSIHGYKVITGKRYTAYSELHLTLARNVGLFRYWSLPNIPLFVLAAPMLWVMITSSLTVLRGHLQPLLHGRPAPQDSATTEPTNNSAVTHYFPELALPQLVLAIAAITSFHVQIVNRLASGYPTWYMIIATWLIDEQTMPNTGAKLHKRNQWIVRGMITYALAQGMLFANFLPPA